MLRCSISTFGQPTAYLTPALFAAASSPVSNLVYRTSVAAQLCGGMRHYTQFDRDQSMKNVQAHEYWKNAKEIESRIDRILDKTLPVFDNWNNTQVINNNTYQDFAKALLELSSSMEECFVTQKDIERMVAAGVPEALEKYESRAKWDPRTENNCLSALFDIRRVIPHGQEEAQFARLVQEKMVIEEPSVVLDYVGRYPSPHTRSTAQVYDSVCIGIYKSLTDAVKRGEDFEVAVKALQNSQNSTNPELCKALATLKEAITKETKRFQITEVREELEKNIDPGTFALAEYVISHREDFANKTYWAAKKIFDNVLVNLKTRSTEQVYDSVCIGIYKSLTDAVKRGENFEVAVKALHNSQNYNYPEFYEGLATLKEAITKEAERFQIIEVRKELEKNVDPGTFALAEYVITHTKDFDNKTISAATKFIDNVLVNQRRRYEILALEVKNGDNRKAIEVLEEAVLEMNFTKDYWNYDEYRLDLSNLQKAVIKKVTDALPKTNG